MKAMLAAFLFLAALTPALAAGEGRLRAREMNVAPGVLAPGPLNAITDVEGVSVGHVTLVKGKDIRTGATAILPHGGNLFQEKVPAAIVVGNGFGKLMGSTQVIELGEVETPIVLTNTLNVAEAASAVIDWTLAQAGNERVGSVNAVVGETNDGGLSNIRKRPLTPKLIRRAIEDAKTGPVAEGAIGAGTGTIAFGWKGGIGTSSRRLPEALGGWTAGVLVQSNFGGILMVDGVPVGEELGRYFLKDYVDNGDADPPSLKLRRAGQAESAEALAAADGSVMIVVATDAPLSDRNLERLAARALAGLARTGAAMTNGSGDYVIAFSTAQSVRRTPERRSSVSTVEDLPNDLFSPLSEAVIEATEEAILNSLFMAETTDGYDTFTGKPSHIEALPLDKVREILGRNGRETQ
jgi:D-aminopeptidase